MTATEQITEPTYSTEDIARLTGASYRQLNYWLSEGNLPDNRPVDNRTSGRSVTFTQTELDVVRLVVQLLRVGFVLDRAFAIARQLVTDDTYRAEFGDIFELAITVRDTSSEVEQPTSQEVPAP